MNDARPGSLTPEPIRGRMATKTWVTRGADALLLHLVASSPSVAARNSNHLLLPHVWTRSVSSGAAYASSHEHEQASIPTLKSQLRRLFKLVHPDFFHSHPHAQAVNQDSFQLLQEYLHAAKGFSRPQQTSYHFVFYLKNETSEQLNRVEITLPRPQIRYVSSNKAEMLPPTREALGNLLFACGLSRQVKGGLISNVEEIRLSNLFQQASEIQRKNETTLMGLDQKMVAAKNALCIGRGIRVSFSSSVRSFTLDEQHNLLKRLGKSLDQCKEISLRGHSIVIGDSSGVDKLGNIWLHYKDNTENWSSSLLVADLDLAMKCKKNVAIIKALEFKVAKLMEVEMIFTHDSLSVHPYYSRFLNEIAEGAACYGAVARGKFHELPIKVIGSPDELTDPDKHFRPMSFELDHTMGYVGVPVWENLTNIYRYIEQYGDEALQSRKKLRQLEEELEVMKTKTRRSLKLRHLKFDPNVSRDKCIIACNRLLRNAHDLSKHTEGLSICVSYENQLPGPGHKSPLFLKWDFSISDL